MIYAIGEPGSQVRMFLETDNEQRAAVQRRPGEVAFVVPMQIRGTITETGEKLYAVHTD